MKILLTGGSGFIGVNLASTLLSLGHDVVALGRRACPLERVTNIECKRLDGMAMRDAVSAHRFDAIFHLAAAGVHPADRDRDELITSVPF